MIREAMPKGKKCNVCWPEVKQSYLQGEGSIADLSKRYNVSEAAVHSRAQREKWKQVVQRLNQAVEVSFEKRLLPLSLSFREAQYKRALAWQGIIDASASQVGVKADNGSYLLDPQAVDQLTKSEARMDAQGRSALGISDKSQVDVTSGGRPLANLGEAVALVQAMVESRGLVPLTDAEVLELQNEPIEGEEIPPVGGS